MSQALFPGWRPSGGEAARLAPVVAALRDAGRGHGLKLQARRPDQWHATLCFIGYDMQHAVTPALLGAFAQAAARIPPHRFSIERATYWPQAGAVVALPFDCPALQALCDATRDAIRRCGVAPLQTTTQPHVTLAYLDRHLPPQDWLDDIDCSGAGTFLVDGFELLFNPGGRYDALERWALTGAELPRPPEQGTLL
ncbi:MAG TPA: 2'-5' RNA ligase family protein [Luteimonas sp.]|nr:2'-5' RNA ligase family protein [Luteimonas sp.]